MQSQCKREIRNVFVTDYARLENFVGPVWNVLPMKGTMPEGADGTTGVPGDTTFVDRETSKTIDTPTSGTGANLVQGPILTDDDFAVTALASEWVTWSKTPAAFPKHPLEVGDVVRLGTPADMMHAQEHTIVEKKEITRLFNCAFAGETADYSDATDDGKPETIVMVFDYDGSPTYPTATIPKCKIGKLSGADTNAGRVFYREPVYVTMTVYRLSDVVRVTMLRQPTLQFSGYSDRDSRGLVYLLQHRHEMDKGGFFPVPMFKVDSVTKLDVQLTEYIKSMAWIKLVGYSLHQPRKTNGASAHELHHDDWIAMHVKGTVGSVLSNDPAAHGAFAILHNGNQHQGGDYHQFEKAGVTEEHFSSGQPLRQLQLTFTDRLGAPAKIARIHLWFQVCTIHG